MNRNLVTGLETPVTETQTQYGSAIPNSAIPNTAQTHAATGSVFARTQTQMSPTTTTQTVQGNSSRKRRIALALIASGAVLGLGTAATLAAWNDSEFATGTFGAGTFALQSSIDGTSFTDSPTAPGKTLSFTLDADLLSPGAVVYAPFSVKLTAASDYAADITLANAAAGTIGPNLSYSVYEVASFGATCSAATPPITTALVADRAADAVGTVPAFNLNTAGEEKHLCFKITAGSSLGSGETGSITWQFVGTSGTAL